MNRPLRFRLPALFIAMALIALLATLMRHFGGPAVVVSLWLLLLAGLFSYWSWGGAKNWRGDPREPVDLASQIMSLTLWAIVQVAVWAITIGGVAYCILNAPFTLPQSLQGLSLLLLLWPVVLIMATVAISFSYLLSIAPMAILWSSLRRGPNGVLRLWEFVAIQLVATVLAAPVIWLFTRSPVLVGIALLTLFCPLLTCVLHHHTCQRSSGNGST